MKYLLLLYIILNPIFFLCDVEPRDAQQLFYQLSSVALFASSFFFYNKEVKKNKAHLWLGVLLLLALYSWIRSMAGWSQALNLLLGTLVYFTVIRTIRKDDIPFILKGIGILGAFAVIYLTLQLSGFDIFGITNRAPPYGRLLTKSSFFYSNSAMGLYFAEIIPLVLALSPFAGICAVGLLIPTVLSQCAVALAGAGIGILFFFWFRKRIVFWCLLIPALAAGAVFLSDSENLWSYQIRLPMWGMVLQDSLKNPLGFGWDEFSEPKQPGHWKYVRESCGKMAHKTLKMIKRPDKSWELDRPVSEEFALAYSRKQAELSEWDHPHNEYLWLMYEGGVASFVALMFIFYYIWQRFERSYRDILSCAFMASLVSIAICAAGQFNLHLARVGHLLPVILGFFYISTEVSDG